MRRLACISALAFAALAPTAHAQQIKPVCTDNSRQCLLTAARSYLDALWTHDGKKVLAHPDIRRTEQGRYPVQGEDKIRESMDMEPDMLEPANTRFFVDEEKGTVVYFTLLRVTGTKADRNRKTYTDNRPTNQRGPSTTHLAERIKVERGLITEIEAIFSVERGTTEGKSSWPDDAMSPSLAARSVEAVPVVKPACTDNSRGCAIAAARSYLDAVTSHDGSKVLAHPAIRRTQNGRVTAEGDVAIRKSMDVEPDMHPHRNTRWFHDKESGNVVAFTLLPVIGTNLDPNRTTYKITGPATTHLAERFRIERGLITEIEAIHVNTNDTSDATSGWPDEP